MTQSYLTDKRLIKKYIHLGQKDPGGGYDIMTTVRLNPFLCALVRYGTEITEARATINVFRKSAGIGEAPPVYLMR